MGEALSEEGEEGEVSIREELYTAWLPTPQTQQLLAQAQPTKDPNYLTCPALVADVRVVSSIHAIQRETLVRFINVAVWQIG